MNPDDLDELMNPTYDADADFLEDCLMGIDKDYNRERVEHYRRTLERLAQFKHAKRYPVGHFLHGLDQ